MISIHVCDFDDTRDLTFKASNWEEVSKTFLPTIGYYRDGQCHHIRMFEIDADPGNITAIAMERPESGAYAMVYPTKDGAPYSSTGTWPEIRDWLISVLVAGDVAGVDIVGTDPMASGTLDQGDVINPDVPELVPMRVTMAWDINHVDTGVLDEFL